MPEHPSATANRNSPAAEFFKIERYITGGHVILSRKTCVKNVEKFAEIPEMQLKLRPRSWTGNRALNSSGAQETSPLRLSSKKGAIFRRSGNLPGEVELEEGG